MAEVVFEACPELQGFQSRYRASMAKIPQNDSQNDLVRIELATVLYDFHQRTLIVQRCLKRARQLAQHTSTNTVLERQVLSDDMRLVTKFLGQYEAQRLLANTETPVWTLQG